MVQHIHVMVNTIGVKNGLCYSVTYDNMHDLGKFRKECIREHHRIIMKRRAIIKNDYVLDIKCLGKMLDKGNFYIP